MVSTGQLGRGDVRTSCIAFLLGGVVASKVIYGWRLAGLSLGGRG